MRQARVSLQCLLEKKQATSLQHLVMAARGAGQPLEPELRYAMDFINDVDLIAVSIQCRDFAWAMTSLLSVPAVTSCCDIFCARDAYRPLTAQGFHILAHRAAHPVQQAQYSGCYEVVTVGASASLWKR